MNDVDLRLTARIMAGMEVNGDRERASPAYRRLLLALEVEPPEGRAKLLEGFSLWQPDPDALIRAVADIDPEGPEAEVASYATLADIARVMAATPWLWRGWLASGVFNVVASEPGTGKTRFAFDLARRLYYGLPWPDGQENPNPAGCRTLFIPGDRNFHEMLQVAQDFSLPHDAVVLNAPPDDPFEGLNLDDPETLAVLEKRIAVVRPILVVIDTVMMTTRRNLCRPEDAREFFSSLMDLAGRTGVALLGLTHLSMGGEALGRRIVEKARTVIKMTCPDPEGQPSRRRLWVDKSAAIKPDPLGVTMGDSGNEYDFAPPTEPEPQRVGRPSAERDQARMFLVQSLSRENDRIGNELRAEWEKSGGNSKTFWRAVEGMEADGDLAIDGGPGTGKQKLLHLNEADLETNAAVVSGTKGQNPRGSGILSKGRTKSQR